MSAPDGPAKEQLTRLDELDPGPRGLQYWIDGWQQLVAEIPEYRGGIADEYVNDLGARQHIARMLDLAHEQKFFELLEWALPIVDATDEQFRLVSQPDIDGLMWGAFLNPSMWWNRRLPNNAALIRHFQTVGPEMRGHSIRNRQRD